MSKKSKEKDNKCPFSSEDLAILCEQMYIMVSSGIMLHNGIESMISETKNYKMRNALITISNELLSNKTLDLALYKAKCFPKYMISIIKIGSEAGTLDKSLKSLSNYYKRQATINESLKSALAYPSVLIGIMALVLYFLTSKVLPIFQNLLRSFGSDLSPVANYIMIFSKYLGIAILAIVALAFIFIGLAHIYKKKTSSSAFITILWQTKLFEYLSLSIFSSTMATTLSSGLSIEQSLDLALLGVYNKNVHNNIKTLTHLLVDEKLTFTEAVKGANIYNSSSVNILLTGEKSGTIDNSMEYIAKYYEDNFENILSRRISLIEPISVAILSTIIGIILVSVLYPLFGIMSVLGA